MRIRILLAGLFLAAWVALPTRSPAPLVYTPGEGWVYEKPGDKKGKWRQGQAEDQLKVAQKAYEEEDYGLALKAAESTVKRWPLSDFAPEAQYLAGRCYEAKGNDEKAFKEYQKVIDTYPKSPHTADVLARQHEIATRFLGGQWFKLWGRIPLYPSLQKTGEMYNKLIANGPYSDVAAEAQLNIGQLREKKKEYAMAVKAYERAADRYSADQEVAAEALFKAGQSYYKQAKTAEYDQNAASQAIETFTSFIALYPEDPRVDEAKEIIQSLKTEQARGSYDIARFYEKKKQWNGALVYYNEVLNKDPESEYAAKSKERIESIKQRLDKKHHQAAN